jgi:hypothetical protein
MQTNWPQMNVNERSAAAPQPTWIKLQSCREERRLLSGSQETRKKNQEKSTYLFLVSWLPDPVAFVALV